MATARRHIVYDGAFTHLIFRCLNREFLFKDNRIKDFILDTWVEYKDKYAVKIFDFCILDNHVHMVTQISNAKLLGNFMRTTNGLIATFVNRLLRRDSHALRERYKSPVLDDDEYLIQCQVYVWTNYYKATGIKPLEYKYSSAFYRGQGLKHPVLSSYDDLPYKLGIPEIRYVVDLLNAYMSKEKLSKLSPDMFEHTHTVGSAAYVKFRHEKIKEQAKANSS